MAIGQAELAQLAWLNTKMV